MENNLLKEAKRLYKAGFAIHWLHPKSKRPIESGWTTGPRKNWDYLKETYIDDLNVGVRLGTPSKLTNGYLCVLDVDVKSSEPLHRKEALRAAREVIGDAECPVVSSGRGNGSRHYYFVTEQPFKTWNPKASDVEVKVHMPSKSPSKRELSSLTPEEINQGVRLSRAWEISLYSDGRQVVLPPSIHPDTGAPYQWVKAFNGALPVIELPKRIEAEPKEKRNVQGDRSKANEEKFTFTESPVELSWLGITDKVRDAILHGTGVNDRSGYLLPAATALFSQGLSRDEILTVLTDKDTFLGACAFDHAKTRDRARAAYWLYKYTVKKVITERTGAGIFSNANDYEAPAELSATEAAEQTAEILEERDWRQDILHTKKGEGPPASTINNVTLILTHAVSPTVVRRNDFAFRDAYGCDTPWGGKKDASLTDDDMAKISHWFGRKWGFEPNREVISNALVVLACQNAYDPVRDALDALPEWDGTPRLGTWLKDHFEAEGSEEYLRQVFSKWIAAMVMRVYHPGAKFDWMPIFEGDQGVGKSSFGLILVGESVFLDWLPNLADKDAALGLQGMWCVEMGELSQFSKTEMEVIKGFLTRKVDKFRPPHGRKLIESPRRCVFFGTTNRKTYLRDDTGNRRFKPVKVGNLDFDCLRRDRDQLFAEAKVYFETKLGLNPKAFDLTGEAAVYELTLHADKMVEDEASVMYEAMQDFIRKVEQKQVIFNLQKFRILDLFSGVGPLNRWGTPSVRYTMFASKMLKSLGFEKRTIKGYAYWKMLQTPEGETFAEGGVTQDFY